MEVAYGKSWATIGAAAGTTPADVAKRLEDAIPAKGLS